MDTPETLAADLLKAAAEAVVATRTVVQVGAFNIKRDWRRRTCYVGADPQRARC
jgi:hypothetical protein